MSEHNDTTWTIRGQTLDLSRRPLVMGILNVTPDSFSDGGAYLDPARALEHSLDMINQGADIIDIGGESSRPGADPVPADEEKRRVLPVIEALAHSTEIPISIDTHKSEVARAAIEAGAHIINDISALRLDPRIGEVAAESGAGLVLMHMQGTPRTMQDDPNYDDLLGEIGEHLTTAVESARRMGVSDTSIVIDPGIGFGKTLEHNWQILAKLDQLTAFGRPILIGTSRKRFLQKKFGTDRRDLENATLATCLVACLNGARIVRVHDIRAHRIATEVLGAVSGAQTLTNLIRAG